MSEEVIPSSMYTNLVSELKRAGSDFRSRGLVSCPDQLQSNFTKLPQFKRDMKNINPCFASALKKAEFTYSLIWVCASLLGTLQMEIPLLT